MTSLFRRAGSDNAFLKMGLFGSEGTGKTHTAALTMIGLVRLMRERNLPGADRPVMMADTETGSDWIAPMFKEADIELLVAKTRAFADLCNIVDEAEANGCGLVIDSVTHYWQEFTDEYRRQKSARLSERFRKEIVADLEFQDWAFIKSEWRKFTDRFVNSQLHITLCGRQAWEYEHNKDERTGKKSIERSGVKMAAETGIGYEPSLLVWMTRDMNLQTGETTRTASVIKDRSRNIDGREFPNPTFASFRPHIMAMNLGGKQVAVDTSRTSAGMIPDTDVAPGDRNAIRRQIAIDEIQALMVRFHPSTSGADKAAKQALLEKHFKTASWTEVERLMPLAELQSNYDEMHVALTGQPSRYGAAIPAAGPVDEIPFTAPADVPMVPPPAAPQPPRAEPPAAVEAAPAPVARERAPRASRAKPAPVVAGDGANIDWLAKAAPKPAASTPAPAPAIVDAAPATVVVVDAERPDELAEVVREFETAETTSQVLALWKRHFYSIHHSPADVQQRFNQVRNDAMNRTSRMAAAG